MGKLCLTRYVTHMQRIPKDGRLLKLLIHYGGPEGHGPLEDSRVAWTIGFNTLKDTGDDEWLICGWNWEQDCFAMGNGEVIDWKPFLSKKDVKRLNKLRKRGMES